MASVARNYRTLVALGFPERYPLVQFPNLPLIVALLASLAGRLLTGTAHDYATAVQTLGIGVWAYLEAAYGVNAFRHALGIVMLISTTITLAHRLG